MRYQFNRNHGIPPLVVGLFLLVVGATELILRSVASGSALAIVGCLLGVLGWMYIRVPFVEMRLDRIVVRRSPVLAREILREKIDKVERTAQVVTVRVRGEPPVVVKLSRARPSDVNSLAGDLVALSRH